MHKIKSMYGQFYRHFSAFFYYGFYFTITSCYVRDRFWLEPAARTRRREAALCNASSLPHHIGLAFITLGFFVFPNFCWTHKNLSLSNQLINHFIIIFDLCNKTSANEFLSLWNSEKFASSQWLSSYQDNSATLMCDFNDFCLESVQPLRTVWTFSLQNHRSKKFTEMSNCCDWLVFRINTGANHEWTFESF